MEPLIEDLKQMTKWPISSDWTRPTLFIQPLGSSVLGAYNSMNEIYVSPACREALPDAPLLYCEAVLLHELAHWAQVHLKRWPSYWSYKIEGEAHALEREWLALHYPPVKPVSLKNALFDHAGSGPDKEFERQRWTTLFPFLKLKPPTLDDLFPLWLEHAKMHVWIGLSFWEQEEKLYVAVSVWRQGYWFLVEVHQKGEDGRLHMVEAWNEDAG